MRNKHTVPETLSASEFIRWCDMLRKEGWGVPPQSLCEDLALAGGWLGEGMAGRQRAKILGGYLKSEATDPKFRAEDDLPATGDIAPGDNPALAISNMSSQGDTPLNVRIVDRGDPRSRPKISPPLD